jgi:large subunit ribosomal protein L31
MKAGIHPDYVPCTVRCSCGNTFVTRATKPELRVELCAECHPFYTGKQKLVDTGGRVERFQRRYARAEAAHTQKAAPQKAAPQKAAAKAPAKKKA